jgi:hypothetical protein
MKFAKDTSVSVARSREQIEAVVMRYGATEFGTAAKSNAAMIVFSMNNRRIRFTLPLPERSDERFKTKREQHGTHRIVACSTEDSVIKHEQACRQKWRAMLLCIKAKLEAVESGISEFDTEFMANIVMKNGQTIGERIIPMLPHVGEIKDLPPLLPGPIPSGA